MKVTLNNQRSHIGGKVPDERLIDKASKNIVKQQNSVEKPQSKKELYREYFANAWMHLAEKYYKEQLFDKALHAFCEATKAGSQKAATQFFKIVRDQKNEIWLFLFPNLEKLYQEIIEATNHLEIVVSEKRWAHIFARYLPTSHVSELSAFGGGSNAGRKIIGYLPQTLTKLLMNDCGMKDTDVLIFARQYLPNLRSLNLRINRIGAEGIEALSRQEYPALKALTLEGNPIGDKGVEMLARMDLSKLTKLDLRATKIGIIGLKELFKKNFSASLKVLSLSKNDIGSEGCRVLAEQDFSNLRYLLLNCCDIDAEGAKALAKNPFKKLCSIHLRVNCIGNRGLEALAPLFVQLQQITISHNSITAKGIEVFVKRAFVRLEKFDISNNAIGNNGLKMLAGSLSKGLTHLDIDACNVTAEGLDALTQQNFSALQQVLLRKNSLAVDEIVRFAKKFRSTLKWLDIGVTKIDNRTAEIFKVLPKECGVDISFNHIDRSVKSALARKYSNCYFYA